MSYGVVFAGATSTVLEQSVKNKDLWFYNRFAWGMPYIGGLLILNAIALTIIYFPEAIPIS
ncbi:MAG: hypothetical protein ACFFDI_01840 [Promethearchaeota archaeon]